MSCQILKSLKETIEMHVFPDIFADRYIGFITFFKFTIKTNYRWGYRGLSDCAKVWKIANQLRFNVKKLIVQGSEICNPYSICNWQITTLPCSRVLTNLVPYQLTTSLRSSSKGQLSCINTRNMDVVTSYYRTITLEWYMCLCDKDSVYFNASFVSIIVVIILRYYAHIDTRGNYL